MAAWGMSSALAKPVPPTMPQTPAPVALAQLPTLKLGDTVGRGDEEIDCGAQPQAGDLVGAWRLIRPLGEGGMGRVYLAERADGAYAQRAAIKLLQVAAAKDARERFEHERQILAGLEHPQIARLLDGGQTRGWPYLVMEFVDGEPLDLWCKHRRLGLEQRLALFDSLCEAVAYAHRHLVIHCDLKPSNVLVDREGRVRLLDFGIARLVGRSRQGAAGITPGYASPEQQAGATPGVASDIYSLGRLLLVLLKPLRPVGAGRDVELDAIGARATATDPARRYGDVGSLQRELERLLAHRPVKAMAGHRSYRLRKLIRRRWQWLAAGLLVIAVTTGFTWRLALERDRARAAEALAQREARSARDVNDFLVGLFNAADSFRRPRAAHQTAQQLLDQGHERLRSELGSQPAQRAPLLAALATVYENLGQSDTAALAYAEAIAAYGEAGNTVAQEPLLYAQAFTLNRVGRYGAALEVAERLNALPLPVPNIQQLVRRHNAKGVVLTNLGRVDQALQQFEAALGLLTPSDDTLRSTLHSNLALAELAAGHPDRAERLIREVFDPKHPLVYRRRTILAMALTAQQRWTEAEAELRAADLNIIERFGPSNSHRHRVLRELGPLLIKLGRPAEGVAALRTAVQCAQEGGEGQTPLAASTLGRLAQALAANGELQAASVTLEAALHLAQSQAVGGDPLGLAELERLRAALPAR